jgi:hypothetical protein
MESRPSSLVQECGEISSPEVASGGDKQGRARFRGTMLAIPAIAAIVAVYLLRLDGVVGQFKDDGWYVVLAKALATGHGYTAINLPASGRYFYPPFFPFLLSLLYRVSPDFPDNVVFLKSLSIGAVLLLAAIVFRLFDRPNRLSRPMAFVLACSTALAPPFVMLATSSVMSECVFTALQFAALLFADRCVRNRGHRPQVGTAWGAALLASAAFLTRTAGIALLAGIGADFLRRKMFREFGVLVATVLFCAGGWSMYVHLHTNSKLAAPGYSSQFWQRNAGFPGQTVSARDLPGRVWQQATVIAGDDIAALLAPTLYRTGGESGQELVGMAGFIPGVSSNPMHSPGCTMGLAVPGQLISLVFSLVVLIGFIASARRDMGAMELVFVFSIAVVVLWPWSPLRLLVPLFPIFLYYLVSGVAELSRWLRKGFNRLTNADPHGALRIVMLCVLALFAFDNVSYLLARQTGPNSSQYPDWLLSFNAQQQAAMWVRDHTAANEVITGDNLPLLYLYAGRQTEMCGVEECVKKGVRYYVVADGRLVRIPGKTVFQPGYPGVEVVDMKSAER